MKNEPLHRKHILGAAFYAQMLAAKPTFLLPNGQTVLTSDESVMLYAIEMAEKFLEVVDAARRTV